MVGQAGSTASIVHADMTLTRSNVKVKVTQLLYFRKLECGPMPNVMVALPNIGGSLCSTPQSLADAHY